MMQLTPMKRKTVAERKEEIKTADLSNSAVMPGSATLTGFTVEEIRKMVDAVYGSCVWERVAEHGRELVFCAPSSTGEVRIFDR